MYHDTGPARGYRSRGGLYRGTGVHRWVWLFLRAPHGPLVSASRDFLAHRVGLDGTPHPDAEATTLSELLWSGPSAVTAPEDIRCMGYPAMGRGARKF